MTEPTPIRQQIVLDAETKKWIEEVSLKAVASIEVMIEQSQKTRMMVSPMQRRAVMTEARVHAAQAIIGLIQAVLNVNTSLSPVFEPLRELRHAD